MQTDPVLALLSGAAVAALIGILGAWIQSRREHSRWVREQRLDAYLAYARATEGILSYAQTGSTATLTAESAQAATAALRLLGPKAVYDAAFAFTVHSINYVHVMQEPDANRDDIAPTYEDLSTARQAFIDAAQRELKIKG